MNCSVLSIQTDAYFHFVIFVVKSCWESPKKRISQNVHAWSVRYWSYCYLAETMTTCVIPSIKSVLRRRYWKDSKIKLYLKIFHFIDVVITVLSLSTLNWIATVYIATFYTFYTHHFPCELSIVCSWYWDKAGSSVYNREHRRALENTRTTIFQVSQPRSPPIIILDIQI